MSMCIKNANCTTSETIITITHSNHVIIVSNASPLIIISRVNSATVSQNFRTPSNNCHTPDGIYPKSFPPQRGVLFVERAIPQSLSPQPGCSVYSTLHSKWAMPVFFRIDRYIQNIPLRLTRFKDGPLYKQNATLGRKRFRDGPFYKQNATLGRKRFRDGPFYRWRSSSHLV